MIRAVVDPGVLVSGVISRGGAPAELVDRWLDAELEIAKRTPNIIWDNSGGRQGFLRRFVEEAGSHKLVLGSTYYSSPPSYRKNRELEAVLESGMREEDMANVLALNVKRLFKLE